MKIALLVPDGVGLRNFLLGSFLRQLGEDDCACILHTIPDELRSNYDSGTNENTQWEKLIPFNESTLSFTLRDCLNYAQMFWGDTQAMRLTRTAPLKGAWRRRMVGRASRLVGRVAATEGRISALDNWHCAAVKRLPEVGHYRRLLERVKPSILFCTHQRPPIILPVLIAAKQLGIPTATFIFSWDNLTSKGRIAAPFDNYLVWSAHMKNELVRYYPDVSPDRIHIVGTPQFDSYADADLLWSRAEFYALIGADPSRPLICYAGGVGRISPEDPEWIRILMSAIREGRVRGKPQVLLRPAPVDDIARFRVVREDYPELLFAAPEWIHTEKTWRDVFPSAADVQFLANLTHHVDLNINSASTMTLDFAIHDKPVVNPAFDVKQPPHFGTPIWDFFYQWEHYLPVVETGAARVSRSPQEFIEHLNDYLEDPTLDREKRRRLVEMQVGHPIGKSSARTFEVLQKIVREATPKTERATRIITAREHQVESNRV